ncbi:hypothetical protein [Kitasatospora sp. NPDC088783]|uniref:hypothetical protein n=1 Tax=Kitasatospora sp. NPDC088783 TaxID=3364077 RepID=UPI00381627F1
MSDLRSVEFPPLRVALPAGNSAGLRWLARLAPDPTACREAWLRGEAAPIPLDHIAVLRVAPELGRRLLRADGRPPREQAPVLYDPALGTLFLVPPPPAAALRLPDRPGECGSVDLAGLTGPREADREPAGPGTAGCRVTAADQLAGLVELVVDGTLMCPAPGRALLRRGGAGWVVEPFGNGHLWDPATVVAAVGADLHYLWSLPDQATPAAAGRGPNLTALARFVSARQEIRAAS